MKILSLHCDYIKFKPLKKALREPEKISKKRQELIEIKEPLVILTAIEKQDESNPDIVKQLTKEITDIAKQINPDEIVLYPYAHLSSSLSKPDFALKTLEKTEKELSKKFKVNRAPFGYYKEFELKCKGHPLSELSREIQSEKEVKQIDEPINYQKLLREISKSKLDTKKLKENDHRIIGKQMDLFSFSETAPGMVFWNNNGLIIKNELIKFWQEEHKKAGYQEISTPQIDEMYEAARSAGAIGGKLLGAGGGGFILFFAKPETQPKIEAKLNRFLHVPFRFENSGSQIIFYTTDS